MTLPTPLLYHPQSLPITGPTAGVLEGSTAGVLEGSTAGVLSIWLYNASEPNTTVLYTIQLKTEYLTLQVSYEGSKRGL